MNYYIGEWEMEMMQYSNGGIDIHHIVMEMTRDQDFMMMVGKSMGIEQILEIFQNCYSTTREAMLTFDYANILSGRK